MPEKEGVNRIVCYATAPVFDSQAEYPKDNNRFQYFRAPEGMLFLLEAVYISANLEGPNCNGIIELSDGHYFTGWNIFPGVENRETLYRSSHDADWPNSSQPLHLWECKEFTVGCRSTSSSQQFKACVIIYYYLKKASRKELMEYAIKHPRTEDTFKKILRGTTVEPSEAGIT